MLTCSFFVFQEISPEGGGALFLRVIWMPVEGRVGLPRHSEFFNLKSGPRENVETSEALKCNFVQMSISVTKFKPQSCK